MKAQMLNLKLEVSEQKLKCPVCDQAFISQKSLYGHMRNHPERTWRGMKPPISDPKSNHSSLPVSGSLSPERNVSLQDSHQGSDFLLPGWLKTGRRTRPGKALMLINPSSDRENVPPKKRTLDSSVSSNPGFSPSGPESSIDQKIPVRARKQHVCGICTRAFRSYQALGGHKAHHNNKAHKIKPTDESSTTAFDLVHECPFCKKIFSKGQALGGHKRHCRGPENAGPSVGGGQVTKNQPGVFSFDLNELPPEWIHEEMAIGEIMKF